MRARIDVLGLGCVAVDDVLYVAGYPPADAKAEVRTRTRHCGGLAANALAAAARLGLRCAYAGTVGYDVSSRFVLEALRKEGISVRHAVRRAEASPVQSVIVVDQRTGSRNIFFHTRNALGADRSRPSEAVIRSCRVLLVDRFGIPGMIRAARIARRAAIPVVSDIESFQVPGVHRLLELVDHLILSREAARRLTGASTAAQAARKLWREDRQAVVVTCGADGCWALDRSSPRPRQYPAFAVQAVDTTGCGDVFHGAYAAGLAEGKGLEERVQLASAVAALKAGRVGGQAAIPTRSEVCRFILTSLRSDGAARGTPGPRPEGAGRRQGYRR